MRTSSKNKDDNYQALAFRCLNEDFEALLNSVLLKYKGAIAVNGVYKEVVISSIDVKAILNRLSTEIAKPEHEFRADLNNLSKHLCRLVYNSKIGCLFMIVEDLEFWSIYATRLGLEKYNLLNDELISKLKKYELPEVSMIEFTTDTNDDSTTILRGLSSENYKLNIEYFRNIKEVIEYKRAFTNHKVTVTSQNRIFIELYDKNLSLHKCLSHCVIGGN